MQTSTQTNKEPRLFFSNKEGFASKVVLGDVVEVLENLERQHKFDVIIADPPYNIGKNFGNNSDNMELKDYIDWSKKWTKLCFELLAENGLMYIYGYPEVLARIACEFELEKQRILVWHYTNKTTPSSSFWQRSYESILCLWRGDRPQLEIDQIREPYTDAYIKFNGKTRTNTKGRFGSETTTYSVNEKGALPRDVIKIPALAGGAGNKERHFICKTCGNQFFKAANIKKHDGHDIIQHPTQKPIELTQKLILSRINGNKGRTLIPFAGSGSECVAAKRLGVDFLGIEINSDYIKLADEWLKSEEKYV